MHEIFDKSGLIICHECYSMIIYFLHLPLIQNVQHWLEQIMIYYMYIILLFLTEFCKRVFTLHTRARSLQTLKIRAHPTLSTHSHNSVSNNMQKPPLLQQVFFFCFVFVFLYYLILFNEMETNLNWKMSIFSAYSVLQAYYTLACDRLLVSLNNSRY